MTLGEMKEKKINNFILYKSIYKFKPKSFIIILVLNRQINNSTNKQQKSSQIQPIQPIPTHQMTTWDQPLFQKQLHFFNLNPPKKHNESKRLPNRSLDFIQPEQQKVHQIIRDVLKDYQYYSGCEKEELNLSEGERVLKMNGIKIIKENNTFFIEKYVTREQNVLKRASNPNPKGSSQSIKLNYHRSQTLSDPRYFLTLLGYSTKQKDYFQYLDLQCYKCPAYGIQVVIYQKWDEVRYLCIEAVNNFQGLNPVAALLIDKLGDLVTEENYNEIDPYTLRPKGLKHGILPDY